MADNETSFVNDKGDKIDDSSKGAIIPQAGGGVTLDNGGEYRDPVPSPVENRDGVRNADDSGAADDTTANEALGVDGYATLAASMYQVGNYDAGSGSVLESLAYPSKKAVQAERYSAQAASNNLPEGTVVGGAEYDKSDVQENSDARDDVLEKGDSNGGLLGGSKSTDSSDTELSAEDKLADKDGDGKLSPAEKRARTLREKKAKEEADAKAAEEAKATDSSVGTSGLGATSSTEPNAETRSTSIFGDDSK